VVEITNHGVNDHLRSISEDKTYSFKLASVDGVLGTINAPPAPTVDIVKTLQAIEGLGKTAGYVDTLPSKIANAKSRMVDEPAEIARLTKIAMHKLSSRLALISRELESERLGKLAQLDNQLGDLFHATKNYLLVDRIPLSDLRKFACELYPERTGLWNVLFTEIKNSLTKLGHPYTGILASDKELSTDYKGRTGGKVGGPQVTVVNGDHGLAIQLAPIMLSVPAAERARDRIREIDNFFSSVRTVEESLDNNEQVEKQLLKTAEELYTLSLDKPRLLLELEKLASGERTRAASSLAIGTLGVHHGLGATKALLTQGIQPDSVKYIGYATPQARLNDAKRHY
jgi:hypothetical protein